MRRLWARLVKFGFRLLYNELAITYDAVSYVVSLGDWRTWQFTALGFLPPAPATILELAHGTGHLQVELARRGYRVIGSDLSPAMSRIAGRRIRRADASSGLVRCRGQMLPFSSQTMDAIVVTFPTSFIFEQATLCECARVLREDGQLVIVYNGMLTRRGIVEDAIEKAYAVTGQRGGLDSARVVTLFSEAGLTARFERVATRRGYAELIVAERKT